MLRLAIRIVMVCASSNTSTRPSLISGARNVRSRRDTPAGGGDDRRRRGVVAAVDEIAGRAITTGPRSGGRPASRAKVASDELASSRLKPR